MSENQKIFYRLPEYGKIAGVCAGVAEYFGLDVTLVRIFFALFIFITGGGALLLYIVMAFIMPRKGESSDEPLSQRANHLGNDISNSDVTTRIRNYCGIGLVIFGFYLLIGQIFPNWFDTGWRYLWPVVLIAFGLIIIFRKGGKK